MRKITIYIACGLALYMGSIEARKASADGPLWTDCASAPDKNLLGSTLSSLTFGLKVAGPPGTYGQSCKDCETRFYPKGAWLTNSYPTLVKGNACALKDLNITKCGCKRADGSYNRTAISWEPGKVGMIGIDNRDGHLINSRG